MDSTYQEKAMIDTRHRLRSSSRSITNRSVAILIGIITTLLCATPAFALTGISTSSSSVVLGNSLTADYYVYSTAHYNYNVGLYTSGGTLITTLASGSGSGSISNTITITKNEYHTAGDYYVRVQYTDEYGISGSDQASFTITNTPVTFTLGATPTSGNEPLSVSFSLNSVGGDAPFTYSWDFGDGSPTSAQQNPSHTYTHSGTYTVAVSVNDNNGDTLTKTTVISVADIPPTPDFSWSPISPYIYDATTFTSISTSYDPIISYSWTVDSTLVSTSSSMSTSFLSSGAHSVTLSVTDSDGVTRSVTKTVTVQNRLVDFTLSATPTSGIEPATFTFNVQNVVGDAPYTYSWNYGDGSASTTQGSTTHTYLQQGTYTVTLIITDMNGDSKTKSVTISVADTIPTADFTWTPSTIYIGTPVSFTSIASGYDQPLSYLWDLGDNTASTQQNPSTTYASSGTKTVRLSVTDADGSSVTVTKTLIVQNKAVNFTLSANPINGTEPFSTSFIIQNIYGDAPFTYNWNYGDGSTSTVAGNTSHTYTQNGTYTTTLTITDMNGDVLTRSVTVTVADTVPVVNFSWMPVTPYANETMLFVGNASAYDGIVAYNWSVDGIAVAATKNYTSPTLAQGNHTVVFSARDTDGSITSSTRTVTVLNRAVNFSASSNTTTGIEPLSVRFSITAVSGDAPFTYVWDFNDGTPASAQQNPTHTFTQNGTYNVTARVTDYNNDTLTRMIFITVVDTAPMVNFSWIPTIINIGTPISFTANASAYDNPLTYSWNFGDGSTASTQQNPTHSYNASVAYNVTLIVTDADGSQTTTTHTLNVINIPVAFNITSNVTSGAEPLSVAFTTLNSDGDLPLSHSWDFGDGSPVDVVANTTHTYAQNGTYNATLTITDYNGDVLSKTITISVFDTAPTLNASWTPTTIYTNTSITFNGVAAAYDGIANYSWNFNDGSPVTNTQNPSHQYALPGNYTVVFSATDNDGSTTTQTASLTVLNTLVSFVALSNTTNGTEPLDVQFSVDNTTGDLPLSYSWDFGDGSPLGTSANTTHTYAQNGTYVASVVVTDANNDSVTHTIIITVLDTVPTVALLITPATRIEGSSLSFTSIASAYDGIIGYSWNFGDGSPLDTAANTTHTYAQNGTYNVTLTTIDTDGSSTSATQAVTITDTVPVADFVWSPSMIYIYDTVTLTSNSTGYDTPLAQQWTIDGVSAGNTPNSTTSFLTSGNHTVTLDIIDNDGSTASITQTLIVQNRLTDFVISTNTTIDTEPATVQLDITNITGDVPYNYNIEYADGTIVNGITNNNSITTTHTYTQNGTYTINVTITDLNGDVQSHAITVTILDTTPSADFSWSPSSPFIHDTVLFTSNAIAYDTPLNYRWSVDGNLHTTTQDMNYTFLSAGDHNITLDVTDADGSINSTTHTITIQNQVVQYTLVANTSGGAEPLSVAFSVDNLTGDYPFIYSWDFGDSSPLGTSANTTHTYLQNGTYNVTIIITDYNGDTFTQSAIVIVTDTVPVADFTWSPSNITTDDIISFTQNASAYDGVASQSWDFGDNSPINTSTNALHQYTLPGTYTIILNVTDGDGSTTSITKVLIVQNKPVDFIASANVTIGIEPATIAYTIDNATGDLPLSYSWNFGDSSPLDTSANTTHTYLQNGTYIASITTTDANNDTKTQNTTITVVDSSPVVDFTWTPNQPFTTNGTQFNSSASAYDGIIGYSWNFGDGTSSNVPDPFIYFTLPGEYNVTLSVTDADGSTTNITHAVTVPNLNVSFDIAASPLNGTEPTGVDFTINNIVGDGAINFVWDFGDGSSIAQQDVTHTYLQNGTYIASVTGIDANNDTLTQNITILIADTTPSADFSWSPSSPFIHDTVLFTSNAIAYDTPLNYRWSVDGNPHTTTQDMNYTFLSAGDHNITLDVTDADGSINSTTHTITIQNQVVQYDISVNTTTGIEPMDVDFIIDNVTGDWPYTYFWDFGDGTNSTQANTTHTYVQNGTYQVTTIVTDMNGDSTSNILFITVLDTVPNANFTWNPSTPYANESVAFYDASNAYDGIVARIWNVDGSNVAATQNYTSAPLPQGTHNVTLTVTDGDNSTSSITQTITVLNRLVDFVLVSNTTTGIEPTGVQFDIVNVTGDAPFSYSWDFGDGSPLDTNASATHMYTQNGTYNATVNITDYNGDSTSHSIIITIADTTPVADFIWTPSTIYDNNTIIFTSNVSAYDGIASYTWAIDTLPVAITQNYTSAPLPQGTHNVTLNVTDADGSTISVIKIITITPTLDFAINATPANGIRPLDVQLSTSNLKGTAPYTYNWDFGDNTTSTQTAPLHTYTLEGNYTVTLTIQDNSSLVQTRNITITVGNTLVDFTIVATPITGIGPLLVNLQVTNETGDLPLTYSWNFGDSSPLDTNANTTHTYLQNGTYNASVTVSDINGDSLTRSVLITVNNRPVNFNLNTNPLSGYEALNVTFTISNLTGTAPYAYSWDFGDGSPIDTSANTTHLYTQNGTYNATITILDSNNMTSNIMSTITVLDTVPGVSFNWTPLNPALNENVNFSSILSAYDGIIAVQWAVDGANVSTSANFTTSFTIIGAHIISLTATDSDGSQTSVVHTLNVNNNPVNYTASTNVTNGTEPLDMAFIINNVTGDAPFSYSWDFGDGSPLDTNANTTHTYLQNGTYNAQVTVTDFNNDTLTRIIMVSIVDTSPIVAFDWSPNTTVLYENDTITFTGNMSAYDGIATLLWDFADGTTNNSTTFLNHSFIASGIYNVTLSAIDGDGSSRSVSKSIIILKRPDITPPVLNVYDPQNTTYTTSSMFFNMSCTDNIAVDSIIYTIDGVITGNYTVPFTQTLGSGTHSADILCNDTSGNNATARITFTINIPNTPVNYSLSANSTSGAEPLSVTFTIDNLTGDYPLTYSWDFGDATTSAAANMTHTYLQNGTYNATLNVVDFNGDSLTTTIPIVVTDTVPIVDFSWNPISPYTNESIIFTSNASAYDGIATYNWSVDNNSTTTTQNYTSTPLPPGTHNITLTVTDSDGSQAIATHTITIQNRMVDFNANVNTTNGTEPTTIAFTMTNITGDAPYTYLWNFADGITSTQQNPTHLFTQNGTYNATATITDYNGDAQTHNITITILDTTPTADFTHTPSTFHLNENVTFTSNSSAYDTPLTQNWYVDGNPTGSGTTLSTSFNDTSLHLIGLTIIDNDGSTDTKTAFVSASNLNVSLVADATPLGGFEPLAIDFSVSNANGDLPLHYLWQFGDGTNSTQANVTHTYMQNGTYNASVSVTDFNMDSSTQSFTISVVDTVPYADFSWVPLAPNVNQTITFTNNASAYDLPIRYDWDFGDATPIDTAATPQHTYLTNGSYNITLTATDADGSSVSVSHTIILSVAPDITPPSITINQPLSITYNTTLIPIDIRCTDNNMVASTWYNIDNGTNITYTSVTVYNTGANGTYTLYAYCNDTAGNLATPMSITFDVNTTNITPSLPLNYTLSANSTIAIEPGTIIFGISALQGAAPFIYAWDFADNTTSTQQNPTHTYLQNGTYTTQVTVQDSNNQSMTQNITIVITDTIPIADFFWNTTSSMVNDTVLFTSNSSAYDGIASYTWDINGSAAGNSSTATYTFSAAGNYTVSLLVVDGDGSNASATYIVIVGGVNSSNNTNATNATPNIINSWINNVYFPSNTSTEVLAAISINISNDSIINNTNITNAPTTITSSFILYSLLDTVSPINNCTAIGLPGWYTQLSFTSCVNAYIDPSTIIGSNISGTSPIINSTILYSNVTNSDSINRSTIINSSADNVTIVGSIVNISIVNNSDLTNSNVTADVITDSTLTNSTITNSTLDNSNITTTTLNNCAVNDTNATSSTLSGCTINNSTITNSNISNSTSIGSNITNSTLNENSSVNGSTLSGATLGGSNVTNSNITNSTITNSTMTNTIINTANITGSNITGGTIGNSTITNSTISGNNTAISNATLDSSTITNSTITNSTITNSSVSNTTIANSTIDNSTLLGVTLDNTSVSGSNLSNTNLTNTIVDNTTLSNITIINGNVTNGLIQNGSVVLDANGNNITINTTTNVSNYFNHAPTAVISATPTSTTIGNTISFTDQSVDVDIGSVLNDSIVAYAWNFGDASTSNTTNATHAYAIAGTYIVQHTVTDGFGLSSNSSIIISITNPISPPSGGGSGGGGGGGGYIPPRNCTNSTSCGAWGACTAGTQIRSCVQHNSCDKKNVNTTKEESRTCSTTTQDSAFPQAQEPGAGTQAGEFSSAQGLTSNLLQSINAAASGNVSANAGATPGEEDAKSNSITGNVIGAITKPSYAGLIILGLLLCTYAIYRIIRARR